MNSIRSDSGLVRDSLSKYKVFPVVLALKDHPDKDIKTAKTEKLQKMYFLLRHLAAFRPSQAPLPQIKSSPVHEEGQTGSCMGWRPKLSRLTFPPLSTQKYSKVPKKYLKVSKSAHAWDGEQN